MKLTVMVASVLLSASIPAAADDLDYSVSGAAIPGSPTPKGRRAV